MPHVAARDGTSLYYVDSGTGLPVLCLPGLTRNGSDFDHVAPYLPGVRLIRPDARGRGQSGWADPATYTVPHEVTDVLTVMDHLGLAQAAIIGTSRGGIQAMVLAATAKDRLLGVALNDIGPVIERRGLDLIAGYLGRNPAQKTWQEAAQARAENWTSFQGVPHARWLAEVQGQYNQTAAGLVIRYDPRLREAVLSTWDRPQPDLWPLFDALAGLPLCLIRGAASDLLSRATADAMVQRRPDMIRTDVPGRGHVPFLDEPEALAALRAWLKALQ